MKSPLESEQISNTDFGNYFFQGHGIWFGGRVALGVGVFFGGWIISKNAILVFLRADNGL